MSIKTASRKPRSSFEQYAREINAIPLLSREDEKELAVAVQAGCPEARERLIRANLRLVVAFAKRYLGRGVEMDEIIAAGNLGLIRGVESFDPAKGCRFSTYGGLWILQAMRKAVDELGPTIRVPAYMVQLLAKWHRAATELNEAMGREPTDLEVARRVGIPMKKVPAIQAALLAYRLEPGDVESAEDHIPFELPDKSPAAEELVISSELTGQLNEALRQLGSPEREVLEMYFGLVDGVEHPMKHIASTLELSAANVKASRFKALEILSLLVDNA
jgi:RNA polymerase primary sigma factor